VKPENFSGKIKLFCKDLGIDLFGIAPADFDKEGEKRLKKFIDNGRNADMDYLENYSLRVNPKKLLPQAKSVIVIGVNYYNDAPEILAGEGRVARYAWGRDYHKVIRGFLKKIEKFILQNEPSAKCKICVDSSPILEKSYAVKAGLGFIGKNTTLINPKYGSFIVLGELLTTLKLEYDKEIKGTCGTCRRCLDACPTGALISAGKMDARRCISYLTIENKKTINKSFQKKMGNRIFGCDTCQEACPYNRTFAKSAACPDFKKHIAGPAISLKEILKIKNDQEFLNRFAGSPLMRAKRKGLQRNARIADFNSRQC
jgi:epoxyqueuosine reductase